MKDFLHLIERKGWALYHVTKDTGGNLDQIVQQGRSREISYNHYYHILPFIPNDADLGQILNHLEMAEKTDQKPYYNGGDEKRFVLDGIEFTPDWIFLYPADTIDFRVKISYENLDQTIKHGFSNYNVYYFDSIDTLLNAVDGSPQKKSLLSHQLRWELIYRNNSKEYILFPSDPSTILFRGQNQRHIPCYPTASRGVQEFSRSLMDLSLEDRAKITINTIKTDWFCEVLKETPHFNWLSTKKIFMDRMALAQHYELPTGLIDLSQSLEVSSFFACCKYSDGAWTPMENGEGIIYVLDYRLLPTENVKAKPIGQQIFPRPSEQWGWTFEMNLGDDFDSLPYVKKLIFKHDLSASERILKNSQNGAKYFPPDPLSIIAERIKTSKELPLQNVKYIINDLISDNLGFSGANYDEVIKLILDYGKHTVSSKIRPVLTEDLKKELEIILESRKDMFFDNCGFRASRYY